MSKVELELLRQQIASKLVAYLEPLFAPEMQITFVARHPTNRECYIAVSSDGDLVEVAKLLMKDQGGKDAHEKGCNR